jgi:hypothetical protein
VGCGGSTGWTFCEKNDGAASVMQSGALSALAVKLKKSAAPASGHSHVNAIATMPARHTPPRR